MVPQLLCTWGSPGELLEVLVAAASPSDDELAALGRHHGFGSSHTSLGKRGMVVKNTFYEATQTRVQIPD